MWIISVSISYGADPGGISGVELWLRADMGAGSSSVSSWTDQSSYHRDATQTQSTYQPTYRDNTANHNPILRYSDDFLDVEYNKSLNGADLTVFVVAQKNSDGCLWSSRDQKEFKVFVSIYKIPKGHYVCYNDDKYKYGNGKSVSMLSSGWDELEGSVSTGNYEIVTTKSSGISMVMFGKIDKNIYQQGVQTGDDANVLFSLNNNKPFRIGKGGSEEVNGTDPWDGDIAEVIVYSSPLDDTNRNRVESYLAIKYGITMGVSYHDSSGDMIWDANNTYGRDVAGVGRDDVSRLDQRVSKSINPDAIITISTDTDFDSSNLIATRPSVGDDESFVIWSNDGGSASWSTTGAPVGSKILGRKWKISKHGSNIHNVGLQVDTDDSDFDIDPFTGGLYLVKGSDLSHATPIPMSDDGGGKWHIAGIDFDDGDLFSFVTDPKLPEMHITKTSIIMNDPINHTTNPKRIPGATLRFCFVIDNNGVGDAEHATVREVLTGQGKENLRFITAAGQVQDISHECNCTNITNSATITHSGDNIEIDLGDINGASDTSHSRGCAYIETTIK